MKTNSGYPVHNSAEDNRLGLASGVSRGLGKSWVRSGATFLGVIAIWVLSYKAAGVFSIAPGVSAWFPAAGVSIVAAAILGWMTIPATFLGQCVIFFISPNVEAADAQFMHVLQWLRHSVIYGAAGLVLARLPKFELPYGSFLAVNQTLIAVLTASGAASLVGTLMRVWSSVTDTPGSLQYFFAFWIGDASGAIFSILLAALVARALVSVQSPDDPWRGMRPSSMVIVITAGLAVAILLVGLPQTFGSDINLLFLAPIAAAAVAIGLGFTGGSVFALATNIGLIAGVRYFGTSSPILELQALMMAALLTGIGVGGAISDQRATARKAAQSRDFLAHMMRLATANELVMGLSHQIKQPLTVLVNHLALIKQGMNAGDTVTQLSHDVEAARVSAVHVADIIEGFRAFVRRQELLVEAVSPQKLIDDSLILLQPRLRSERVILLREIEQPISDVLASSIHIQQVLHNLISNAIDAVSGRVTRRIEISARSTAAGIEFSVSDSGEGFERQQSARPAIGLSSKPGGLGFGLAICRTILEAHESKLTIDKGRETGARVRFTLSTGAA